MAAILTAEDVVRRIAAECAYVDERQAGVVACVAAAGRWNQNAPATGSGGASKEEAVDDGLGHQ
jgi:hypothetical protein